MGTPGFLRAATSPRFQSAEGNAASAPAGIRNRIRAAGFRSSPDFTRVFRELQGALSGVAVDKVWAECGQSGPAPVDSSALRIVRTSTLPCMDVIDAAAQPRCGRCGVLMRDATDGWVCPGCGRVVEAPAVDVPPRFDGLSIRGG